LAEALVAEERSVATPSMSCLLVRAEGKWAWEPRPEANESAYHCSGKAMQQAELEERWAAHQREDDSDSS